MTAPSSLLPPLLSFTQASLSWDLSLQTVAASSRHWSGSSSPQEIQPLFFSRSLPSLHAIMCLSLSLSLSLSPCVGLSLLSVWMLWCGGVAQVLPIRAIPEVAHVLLDPSSSLLFYNLYLCYQIVYTVRLLLIFFCTLHIYCMAGCPGRGIPPLFLGGVFPYPIWGSKDRECHMLCRL